MLVNTVLGTVPAEELGQTLMHEHITCADWSMRMNFGDKFLQYDKLVEMAVGQLKKAKEHGISTFVDGTAVNLGRDIRLLRDVAKGSGVNIVASSGFYYQEEAWLAMRDEGEIHDLLLDECLNGISGTDSLPGIMKNGITRAGVTPLQRKLLHCVGTVAKEAGLPIFCHHDPRAFTGYEVLDIYASAGVDPCRVILGHTGDGNDWAYQEDLVKAGAYIGFDRLAYGDKDNPVENSVRNIISLCEKGFINRIFLSHDWATYLAFWDSWEDTVNRDYLNLDVDFTYVSRVVIPMLRSAGLTDADIHQIMVENPKNFFNGE
ncbi:MAG: phosphotriesterase [Oscillospiraceae bacterium]|nr:phosphotriesterase [Oscillospiraceae bacterium]